VGKSQLLKTKNSNSNSILLEDNIVNCDLN